MATVKGTNQAETIDKSNGTTDGKDVIFGLDGNDVIIAFGGNDIIKGGGGADTIHGGNGSDTAAYTLSEEGVFVSLASGTGSRGEAEGDTLVSIENLAGSRHADTFWGNNDMNRLEGMDGSDTLKGFGGNDGLYGGDDNDILYGGEGGDWLIGGAGVDTMAGGEGSDTYYVDHQSDVVIEFDDQGYDQVYVSAPSYVLPQGADIETASAANAYQAVTLVGNSGDNQLIGSQQGDVLSGGGGSDYLLAGDGADTFLWWSVDETGTTLETADHIGGFDYLEGDRIHLSYADANVYAAGDQAFTFIGQAAFSGTPGEINYYHLDGDTYIHLQTGESPDVEGVIRITGIHTPEASWFVL